MVNANEGAKIRGLGEFTNMGREKGRGGPAQARATGRRPGRPAKKCPTVTGGVYFSTSEELRLGLIIWSFLFLDKGPLGKAGRLLTYE